jgi:hypothetical protein
VGKRKRDDQCFFDPGPRWQASLSTLEDSILANVLLKQVEMNWGLLEWTMPASKMLAKLAITSPSARSDD